MMQKMFTLSVGAALAVWGVFAQDEAASEAQPEVPKGPSLQFGLSAAGAALLGRQTPEAEKPQPEAAPSAEEVELRRAAEAGDAEAQYRLARFLKPDAPSGAISFINGYVLKRVPTVKEQEALQWYAKAAEQGHAEAQYGLALCYENGDGVEENKETAAHWYRKAAEQGHVQSQFNLASYYYVGEGVECDKAEAIRLFRSAALAGHVDAQYNMGMLYTLAEDMEPDPAEAVRWFRMAAEQGEDAAQHLLGVNYEEGKGVPADRQEALKWYRKAAAQGHEQAIKSLERLGEPPAPQADVE